MTGQEWKYVEKMCGPKRFFDLFRQQRDENLIIEADEKLNYSFEEEEWWTKKMKEFGSAY